ncbi:MAG: CBS domain-containing protein [Dehalococcoidia bacterium]|nr:MAG: CBS domain-containing protein [Dehalococcoidia bacterium]UCG82133.1 MAG: CBS domain-containing protein [Dehalococcoidia bacterium]
MAFKKTARDIMTSTVITAKEDMLITDVIKLLLRWHISGLPIVDNDGNLVGIITEHDVVNFALSGQAADTVASEVMTKKVVTYSPDTLAVEIINYFAAHRIRRVPVVEGSKVVGIISRRDIVRYMDQMYSRLVAKEEETEIEI